MRPSFRRRQAPLPPAADPERLFDDLPRTRDGAPSLWAHQADMLREYHEHHVSAEDLALELPTGAGKTLPALLIAEWRRMALGQRVAYACPNHQLAHQVAAEATRQGIGVVTLVGPHQDWPTPHAAKYEGARAVAISTYSTIFNMRPALAFPETLIFDDAHAAEQYVASAWSVAIDRSEHADVYGDLLQVLAKDLSGNHVQRLADPSPDPRTRREVSLLPLPVARRRADDIDAVLARQSGDLWFRFAMIRGRLDRCLFYLGWEGMLIRPYIPPTFDHQIFAGAKQRLYVSATLGEGGELERAFGRSPITRLPVPPGWDRRGSGRRFFVFPDLMPTSDPRRLARDLAKRAGKALVLTPSNYQLDKAVEDLVPEGVAVFGKGDVETSLGTFADASSGVLALANRYDGMDLPDEACRMTILDGAPGGAHMQERFLVTTLGATRVIEERIRTRVIQGAGRSTRGLKDFSVVVILGDELTRFLSRREVRLALRPEVQAELQFGLDNSEVGSEELRAFVDSFLNQDDVWQEEAEPAIGELRRGAKVIMPQGTDRLAQVVSDEVTCWERVWSGNLTDASRIAQELSRHITEESLRPYRALWAYLASGWLEGVAEEEGNPDRLAAAKELLRKAHAIAKGTTWLREVQPLPAGEDHLDEMDQHAVEAAAAHPALHLSAVKWAKLAEDLLKGLEGTAARPFETQLSVLGGLLGAEAFKPQGQGRADSVWLFDEHWWLALEAKSEAKSEGLVSMDDIRRANTQLKSLAADRNQDIPPGSRVLVVSPKLLVDPDAVAVADPWVYLCSPADIVDLARDTVEAWRRIRTSGHGLATSSVSELIEREFTDRRLLPTFLRQRVATRPACG